jgi:hypothetical protein
VAAQIGCEHTEVFSQRLKHLEPVERTGGEPAVQQDYGWSVGGTGDLSKEGRSSTAKVQVTTLGKICRNSVASDARNLCGCGHERISDTATASAWHLGKTAHLP